MWRSLTCLGIVLGLAGLALAQDRPTRRELRDIRRGNIVRVDPAQNVVIVRSGTGADAREIQYRVMDTTRYWGTDRQPFNTGLRYQGFREGSQVWFTPGAGDNAQTISQLWFYEPAQQAAEAPPAAPGTPAQPAPGANNQVVYQEARIVRVDPANNIVVVRTGTGADAREVEYRVDRTTRYWGTNQQPFESGLRYEGFREGSQIWFVPAQGDRSRFMSELRFYNPRTGLLPRR